MRTRASGKTYHHIYLAHPNRRRYPAKFIKVMVDSQAALKALCGKDINTEMVRQTAEELSKLGFEIPQLTLTWIKAHVAHNERKSGHASIKNRNQQQTKRANIQ